jgi:hypothetical protein
MLDRSFQITTQGGQNAQLFEGAARGQVTSLIDVVRARSLQIELR